MGIGGAGGNAATRLEAYVSKNGIYTSGVMPEIEDLFQRQARELDRKKREALLHQIQEILHDRVMHVPIYELAFIWGVGPRVEEAGRRPDPELRLLRALRGPEAQGQMSGDGTGASMTLPIEPVTRPFDAVVDAARLQELLQPRAAGRRARRAAAPRSPRRSSRTTRATCTAR